MCDGRGSLRRGRRELCIDAGSNREAFVGRESKAVKSGIVTKEANRYGE